jgi:hypothetical protein
MAYLIEYRSNNSRVLNLFRFVNAMTRILAESKDKIRC